MDSSINFIGFVLVVVMSILTLINFIIFTKMNESKTNDKEIFRTKKDYKEFLKIFAVVFPVILVILIVIFIMYSISKIGFSSNVEIFKTQNEVLIGIIGLAVSVWIGLNIYNLISKDEIDIIQKKTDIIQKKTDEKIGKILADTKKELEVLYKNLDVKVIEIIRNNNINEMNYIKSILNNKNDTLNLKEILNQIETIDQLLETGEISFVSYDKVKPILEKKKELIIEEAKSIEDFEYYYKLLNSYDIEKLDNSELKIVTAQAKKTLEKIMQYKGLFIMQNGKWEDLIPKWRIEKFSELLENAKHRISVKTNE